MDNFEKKPPKELEEISDMRRGRDYSKLREQMIKETEEGIEQLLKEDAEKEAGKDK